MSPCSGLLRIELLLQNPKKRSTPFSANCCGSASCSTWLKWRAWFSPSAGSGLAFQSAMGSCKREGGEREKTCLCRKGRYRPWDC